MLHHAHGTHHFDRLTKGGVYAANLRRPAAKVVGEIVTAARVRLVAIRKHATAIRALPQRPRRRH